MSAPVVTDPRANFLNPVGLQAPNRLIDPTKVPINSWKNISKPGGYSAADTISDVALGIGVAFVALRLMVTGELGIMPTPLQDLVKDLTTENVKRFVKRA